MRTAGSMGRMADRMTRSEKNELLNILGRIEIGVKNATGQLDYPQTAVEMEDTVISRNYSNVTPLHKTENTQTKQKTKIVNNPFFEEVASNVVFVNPSEKVTTLPKPIKAFPKEFYDYFEFIEPQEKTGS